MNEYTATDRYAALLYQCTLRGFCFDYDTAEQGGPLVGIRHSADWLVDTIHIEGIDEGSVAWRQSGEDELLCKIEGGAATVMAAALNWGATRELSETP